MGRPLKLQGTARLPQVPRAGQDMLPWAQKITKAVRDVSQMHVKPPVAPKASQTHAWKVTDAGGGDVDIAAGYIFGMFFTYSAASGNDEPASVGSYGPDQIVMGPASSYDGGTTAITGTKYVYAEIDRNGKSSSGSVTGLTEYSEGYEESDVYVLAELFDDISADDWVDDAPSDTVTIATSSSPPHSYTPTTDKAAVCVAKVENDGSDNLTITQYVTHNPTVFVPFPNVRVTAPV